MGDVALRVEGLGKRYRLGAGTAGYATLRDSLSVRKLWRRARASQERPSFWALKDINFEVKRGEVVGVIGRNGAGKSTLLKILSRITEPTEGGADIHGRVGSLLEVGTGFHPELTGRENIALNGAILGMRRAEVRRKFDDIVAFAEVEQFIDTPVKHYSSGMYTRLAFAVAAHLEPDILIVDEVLAVGDAQFQTKCLGKMQDVAEGGRTVLFVSHNVAAIQRLCNRLVLLQNGSLVADGAAHTVISQYTGTGTEFCPERAWTPEDAVNRQSKVQLRRARVLTRDGRTTYNVQIEQGFGIELEYYTPFDNLKITAIVHMYNSEGVCLFSSNEYSMPEWRTRPARAGVVRAVCNVPGNLMAEGSVWVLVALGSYNPNVVHAIERDALSFQIVDKAGDKGVRGEYVGDWPGVMRPMLNWQGAYVD